MRPVRLPDPEAARVWCEAVRNEGLTLGFVPTMGSLHEGHLSLVRRSVDDNDRTCVSVFVNPLQFDERGDFEAYPRDWKADAELLATAGCDMLFTGTLPAFFPEANGADDVPRRDPGPAAAGLEGVHRPGHFAGVATIVARLFALVEPSAAYFGEKDFQQTLVVRDLAAGPRVVVCPTSREPDGLARSSRNRRLSADGRRRAVGLAAALFATRRRWRGGERDASVLRNTLAGELVAWGFDPEYASVRDPSVWQAEEPQGTLRSGRAFVAARVDGVRLIDTLALDGDDPEPPRLPPRVPPELPSR